MTIARKKKVCKTCGEEKYIFSKGNCEFCSKKTYSNIKSYTPKAKVKRQEERKDYPEFFAKAIEELKKHPYCQNCGGEINVNLHPVNNIGHILKKSKFKSVATHPENYLILCSEKDNIFNCHERFDNHINDRPNMECFTLAYRKFKKFEEEVVERGKEFSIFADANKK